MSESILKCENLCFSYDDELSLNNISLNIKRGSITAVLGRNGAGKSTLFLTLNGINIKDKGSVYFNDKLVEYNKKGIAEIRKNKEQVAIECSVDPERYDMMVVMPVGYSDESPEPTPRKRTLDEVIISRK